MFPRIGGGQKITRVMQSVDIPTNISVPNKHNRAGPHRRKKAAQRGGTTLLGVRTVYPYIENRTQPTYF
jgi:hypothetical protein